MKTIVGLGNPGLRYVGTRHNIGFEAVDRLASAHGAKFGVKAGRSRLARVHVESEKALLVKPQTMMNLSGAAIKELRDKMETELEDLLVVVDDFALPLGSLRFRREGTSGGHNGLQSIVESLGTGDFQRLRVGIGEVGRRDVVDFVLSRFRPSERKVMNEAVIEAAQALEFWVLQGIEAAMNRYNKRG